MSSPTSASTDRKVGLLFGSFNPIHTGHLILAQFMATHTDLDEVWLVVSPQSPFKAAQDLLDEKARFDLVQLAIADNDQLKALDIEFSMPKPSYTIDTLDKLHLQYPTCHFVLIIGGDNLPGLSAWKEAERILAENEVYVYPRPGTDITAVPPSARIQIVEAPLLDISATFIRACVRTGKSIRYLVPERVEQQIQVARYWQG